MSVYIHDIIQLTLINIMMKMKNRSHRHINRPRPRLGHR